MEKARERAAKMCKHVGKTRACTSKMIERVGLSRVLSVAMPSCNWKTSHFFAKMLQPDRKQGANAKGWRHFRSVARDCCKKMRDSAQEPHCLDSLVGQCARKSRHCRGELRPLCAPAPDWREEIRE